MIRLRVRSLALSLAACLMLVGLAAPQPAQASNAPFLSTKGRVAPPSGAQSLCKAYHWACATARSGGAVTAGQMQIVREINTRINRRYREIGDRQQYGVTERWAMPTSRGGDCEDFALAKKRELIRYGIDPQRLLIATALDRRRGAHAVLIFRSDQGDLVLDNLTNRILNWQKTGYIFMRMQDPNRPSQWVNVLAGG